MASSAVSAFTPSVQLLEAAFDLLLQNNFDADSKTCVVTLIKLLDNVLHKPLDGKVRKIRINNPAIWQKVASRRGGLEFLISCGFLKETEAGDDFLVLREDREVQSHLITARRLLMIKAIQELQMNENELPAYKKPPPPLQKPTLSSTTASDPATGVFNPYQGQRYDAQSAAAGVTLGPSKNYVSPTERELEKLQQQQKKIESKLQKERNIQQNREWIAVRPGESAPHSAPSASAVSAAATESSANTMTSDGSLLATRAKKQMEDRLKRENGPLTTKAMRDLQKLKQQKVYSHCILTIQFPDGLKLIGNFLPNEKLEAVYDAMNEQCFLPNSSSDFDLYITPPRRLLTPRSYTLQQLDLVPAAKVFLSWKAGRITATTESLLQPQLFSGSSSTAATTTATTNMAAAFPTAVPVVQDDSDKNNTEGGNKQPASANAKKPAVSKEDALLQRMMGGGGLGLGGSKKKKTEGGDNTNNSSTGKPKWFK